MVVALILLGGVLAMDGVAVGQFMVSRPLVAGILAGALAGDPAAGATVGLVLEIYLLVAVPTGGARFPEPGPATVVGAAAAASTGGAAGLALGVAGAMILGQVGGITQSFQRSGMSRVVPVPGSQPVSARLIARAHLTGVALDGLRGMGLTAAGLLLAGLVIPLAAEGWPLGLADSRHLVLAGGFVSLGILARGQRLRARRMVLFGLGVGFGLAVRLGLG